MPVANKITMISRGSHVKKLVFAALLLTQFSAPDAFAAGEGDVQANSKITCTNATANPVLIATGEKVLPESDFQAGGDYGLGLQRTYRSKNATGSMFCNDPAVPAQLKPLTQMP